MTITAPTELVRDPPGGAAVRRTTTVAAALLLAVAAAWWETIRQARSMAPMVQGLAQIGRAMPFTTGPLVFMGMWLTMMAAMMVPVAAPTVLRRSRNSRQVGGASSGVLFLAGYLGVWACIGAAAFAALAAMRHLSGPDAWIERAGGAAFVLAGLYQFTPWKGVCLRACRPGPDVRSTVGGSPVTALTAGTADGLACLGACWALMSVLLVVGVMNVKWMAALAVVLVLERHTPLASRTVGILGGAGVAIGIAILAHPALLSSIGTAAHHRAMIT
jgi:predicted metal-binding membrane protein